VQLNFLLFYHLLFVVHSLVNINLIIDIKIILGLRRIPVAVSNYSNDDLVAMIANLNPEQREVLVEKLLPDMDPAVVADLQAVAPDMTVAEFENEIGFPGWTSAAKEDVAHALDMAKGPQLTPKGFAVNTDEEDEEQENSMSGPQPG
jgi:hypothetical protein